MKCRYCQRTGTHDYPDGRSKLCDSCADAFRDGFEHGRIHHAQSLRNGRRVRT